jgi:hypothetical protein
MRRAYNGLSIGDAIAATRDSCSCLSRRDSGLRNSCEMTGNFCTSWVSSGPAVRSRGRARSSSIMTYISFVKYVICMSVVIFIPGIGLGVMRSLYCRAWSLTDIPTSREWFCNCQSALTWEFELGLADTSAIPFSRCEMMQFHHQGRVCSPPMLFQQPHRSWPFSWLAPVLCHSFFSLFVVCGSQRHQQHRLRYSHGERR